MTSSTSGRRTRPCWTSGRPPGWKSSRASPPQTAVPPERKETTQHDHPPFRIPPHPHRACARLSVPGGHGNRLGLSPHPAGLCPHPLVPLRGLGPGHGGEGCVRQRRVTPVWPERLQRAGGIYALARAAGQVLGLPEDLTWADLQTEAARDALAKVEFVTATDGNHGRGGGLGRPAAGLPGPCVPPRRFRPRPGPGHFGGRRAQAEILPSPTTRRSSTPPAWRRPTAGSSSKTPAGPGTRRCPPGSSRLHHHGPRGRRPAGPGGPPPPHPRLSPSGGGGHGRGRAGLPGRPVWGPGPGVRLGGAGGHPLHLPLGPDGRRPAPHRGRRGRNHHGRAQLRHPLLPHLAGAPRRGHLVLRLPGCCGRGRHAPVGPSPSRDQAVVSGRAAR